ncbi:MAG TPA: ChrR family anti-sigma-E factor [Rhizomicrobium sp.]|jgi:putative transcriptional regulator
MSIVHHPGEELLIAYAAGASDEAVSLIVATHLALCPDCRREVANAESAGGALLEDMQPVHLSDAALPRVLSRLNGAEPKPAPRAASRNGFKAPEPLRSYLGGDLDQVRWRPVAKGLAYRPILKRGRTRAQLVKSAPGHGVSLHTHKGEEFSLVLTGGYTDANGHYLRGDLQTATPETLHHPIADGDDDCIILAVNDAPLRFKSPAMALLAKVFGF